MHKVFIDIKLSMTNVENEPSAFIVEIERGSEKLLADYNTALKNVKWTSDIEAKIRSHIQTISAERKSFIGYRESVLAEV